MALLCTVLGRDVSRSVGVLALRSKEQGRRRISCMGAGIFCAEALQAGALHW
jgi:hypothetical protein